MGAAGWEEGWGTREAEDLGKRKEGNIGLELVVGWHAERGAVGRDERDEVADEREDAASFGLTVWA
jgi:hypothetical protein